MRKKQNTIELYNQSNEFLDEMATVETRNVELDNQIAKFKKASHKENKLVQELKVQLKSTLRENEKLKAEIASLICKFDNQDMIMKNGDQKMRETY